MADEEQRSALAKQIELEVTDYLTKPVSISDGVDFSQHKLVRRIGLFENHVYPTGKFDKQGNYKYWFDIISPRIDSEVKNIDFDTKDIEIYSPRKIDQVPDLICNLKLDEWLRNNGQAEELNSAIEEGSGWGNVVWKKIKGSYERVDLRNVYVIKQSAQSLKETPVIERHQLSQTEVRNQKNWKNTAEVLSSCGQNVYKSDIAAPQQEMTTPYYLVFERNGEVKLSDLKEITGEGAAEGDAETYVLAKVIAVATEGQSGSVKVKYITYAQRIGSMPYKEYHRGRYKGRWWREGLYENLFDLQVRANEIGNQIAQGLSWAAKTIFDSPDKLVVQNVLTDLKNGDVIRTQGLKQVEVRMQGLDQLVADWNRVIQQANEIANSREIVQGESMPAGMPFRLGALLNVNANKLFDFIREKLSIPLREIFEEWIIPRIIQDLKVEDVIRLTGDSEMLRRMHELIVDDWYVRNLIDIGPHSQEIAKTLKAQKMEELKNRPLFLSEFRKTLEDYRPRANVVITGENTTKAEELQTYGTFIQLESDPVRRSYLIEKAMRRAGMDVGDLPRSTPDALNGVARPQPSPSPFSAEAVPTA